MTARSKSRENKREDDGDAVQPSGQWADMLGLVILLGVLGSGLSTEAWRG